MYILGLMSTGRLTTLDVDSILVGKPLTTHWLSMRYKIWQLKFIEKKNIIIFFLVIIKAATSPFSWIQGKYIKFATYIHTNKYCDDNGNEISVCTFSEC